KPIGAGRLRLRPFDSPYGRVTAEPRRRGIIRSVTITPEAQPSRGRTPPIVGPQSRGNAATIRASRRGQWRLRNDAHRPNSASGDDENIAPRQDRLCRQSGDRLSGAAAAISVGIVVEDAGSRVVGKPIGRCGKRTVRPGRERGRGNRMRGGGSFALVN